MGLCVHEPVTDILNSYQALPTRLLRDGEYMQSPANTICLAGDGNGLVHEIETDVWRMIEAYNLSQTVAHPVQTNLCHTDPYLNDVHEWIDGLTRGDYIDEDGGVWTTLLPPVTDEYGFEEGWEIGQSFGQGLVIEGPVHAYPVLQVGVEFMFVPFDDDGTRRTGTITLLLARGFASTNATQSPIPQIGEDGEVWLR